MVKQNYFMLLILDSKYLYNLKKLWNNLLNTFPSLLELNSVIFAKLHLLSYNAFTIWWSGEFSE